MLVYICYIKLYSTFWGAVYAIFFIFFFIVIKSVMQD